ncbi:hypothetical protein SUGI_0855250 [Cryptomeria japonica]|nr:hypothetical protein SUGI_0855250 [Cryptomeria japonica]
MADVDDFYEWASDEEVTRFMTWEPFKSKQHAREYVANVVIHHSWFKAICIQGSSKVIGHIMLKQGNGMNSCRAEMGYAISRKYWKMGVTTQAVITALEIRWKELQGITRIEALVLPNNVASARVLEKAGFMKDGLLRNYVYLKGSLRDCLLFSFVVASSIH